jgi:hypothetical protein
MLKLTMVMTMKGFVNMAGGSFVVSRRVNEGLLAAPDDHVVIELIIEQCSRNCAPSQM